MCTFWSWQLSSKDNNEVGGSLRERKQYNIARYCHKDRWFQYPLHILRICCATLTEIKLGFILVMISLLHLVLKMFSMVALYTFSNAKPVKVTNDAPLTSVVIQANNVDSAFLNANITSSWIERKNMYLHTLHTSESVFTTYSLLILSFRGRQVEWWQLKICELILLHIKWTSRIQQKMNAFSNRKDRVNKAVKTATRPPSQISRSNHSLLLSMQAEKKKRNGWHPIQLNPRVSSALFVFTSSSPWQL